MRSNVMKSPRNPLHTAVLEDLTEVISDLLIEGAYDINARDPNGDTPLHSAVESQNMDNVNLLLDFGADANAINSSEKTPLFLAIKSRNLTVLKILIDAPTTNLEMRDSEGYTLLDQATKWGNSKVVKLLINARANVNSQNVDGFRPLHYATELGNANTVKVLIDAGADVNAEYFEGNTPLHLATWSEDTKILKMLLDSGANVNAQNFKRNVSNKRILNSKVEKTLGGYALRQQFQASEEEKTGDTPLHIISLTSDNEKIFHILLNAGAKVNAKDHYGVTPLHLVAHYSKNVNIMKILLSARANVNVKDCNGHTPLHAAIGSNNVNLTMLLLNSGASVDAKDRRRNTPLHVAIALNDDYIAKLLLDFNADVIAYNEDMKTPMQMAVDQYLLNKNNKILRLLLDACADIDRCFIHVRDYVPKRNWVSNHKIEEILELLIQYLDVNQLLDGKNIYSNFQKLASFLPKETVDKIIIGHTAKLKALELPVNSNLIDYNSVTSISFSWSSDMYDEIQPNRLYDCSSSDNYKEYFNKCTQELEKAKTINFVTRGFRSLIC